MTTGRDYGTNRRSFFGGAGVGMAFGALSGAVHVPPALGSAANAPTDGIFDVQKYGARGDGGADDTAAIQAAVDAAGAAGGGIVFFPAGVYRITASLQCRFHNTTFLGAGAASVIQPTGDYDTLRFHDSAELYRNRVADLTFDEREKTGGRTISGEHVAQLMVERVYGVFGWNGWHFHNFNCVTLNDCRFESYRGECYGRATGGGHGPGQGRSDVLRLCGVVHGGTRVAGMTGLDIDGFVHTVSGAGVYQVNLGGKGLWAHNSLGAENHPSFFTFSDFEADYPDGEAIRLEVGEHFYFNNTLVHATRQAAANIYVAPEAKGVTFTGGFSTGSQQAGIEIDGHNVVVSGMHFHANSSPEFGGRKNAHPGIRLGQHARDVVVSACQSGREAVRDYQSCGCQIEAGADRFVITGNNFWQNVTPGVTNLAGDGPTRLIAHNL